MSEPVTIAPECMEQLVALVAARVQPPAALPRLLSSAEVMELLGYTETEPFLRAARAAKCPIIRLNARKILFDPADVRAWLDRLKREGAPVVPTIEIGGSRRRKGEGPRRRVALAQFHPAA